MKKKAFTLAEVLMVIGIIGVVATLTLPNLKDSSDEQVNVSKAHYNLFLFSIQMNHLLAIHRKFLQMKVSYLLQGHIFASF